MYFATIIDSKKKHILFTIERQEYSLSMLNDDHQTVLIMDFGSVFPSQVKRAPREFIDTTGDTIYYWDISEGDIKLDTVHKPEKCIETRVLTIHDLLKYGRFMCFKYLHFQKLFFNFAIMLNGKDIEPCPVMSRISSLTEEEQMREDRFKDYLELTLRNVIPCDS